MGKAATKVAVAISALWLSGCGTVYNLCGDGGRFGDGDKKVYGGVVTSAEYARYFVSGVNDLDSLDVLPTLVVATAHRVFVDMPLSAIGDTLTLPWTISATLDQSRRSKLNSAFDVKASEEPNLDGPRVVEPTPGKTAFIYDAKLRQ